GYGDSTRGLVPVALATLACGTAALVRLVPPSEAGLRRTAIVWAAVVALAFITLAIPLQLRNEWVTIGWALQGAVALVLWRRIDHAGLKYYAASLLTAVTVRLTLNPELLAYHPASGFPVLNWLAYTYLVPAGCLLVGAWALGALEVQRYRELEASLFSSRYPAISSLLGVFAIVVGFAWINLTIYDAFAAGRELELLVDRLPARDLTQSLAWALYALILLVAGVYRTSAGLRGLSLGLMLLTCGKVFLYDLGALEELYRVASLVGLALSLIGISLLYQRFVFRSTPEAP
ncbi:MAG: DUF2339 domain-containing protein, partial [Polyangiaceae bacterium]|nr:DUF2339 domain-containing protein [Polyangiaceae bacterium]